MVIAASLASVLYYFIETDNELRLKLSNLMIEYDPRDPRPYSNDPDTIVAYHMYGVNVTKIFPIQYDNHPPTRYTLPSTLVIEPGYWDFHDQTFDLGDEGMYRFIRPGFENQQRIVYGHDIPVLLSSVAWIHSHGNSDNEKTFDEQERKAVSSKLFMTCGSISSFAHDLLKRENIESRIVTMMTLDDLNTYDNGHVMIEVWDDILGKWVVYDLDNNVFFTSDGNPLNLYELLPLVATDDYEIEYLSNDARLDVSNFISGNFDYSLYSESVLADEQSMRDWYKRVIQVMFVKEGGYYFTNELVHKDRVQSYSDRYKFLDREEFDKFYAGDQGKL